MTKRKADRHKASDKQLAKTTTQNRKTRGKTAGEILRTAGTFLVKYIPKVTGVNACENLFSGSFLNTSFLHLMENYPLMAKYNTRIMKAHKAALCSFTHYFCAIWL